MASEQTSDVGTAAPAIGGGHAPGLAGVRGRLRIDVGGKTFGVIEVDDARVELKNDGAPTDAVLTVDSPEDVKQILSGVANPVVLALQGRSKIQGNLVFAVKVVLGLRAGSPFAGAQKKGG